MKITSHLFEAFLKCATKCHLRSLGENGSGDEYAVWVRAQDKSYQREATRRLQEGVPETERIVAPSATENLKTAKWRLAVDLVAQTSDNLRDQTGCVWVVTTMDKVHFFYRPSREASFLTEMFGAFSGILVSDFFTGYDSMPCPQQKCLVHLVRELDDDLIHNPFNDQFKVLAQGFGSLLRPIIETIDCYGLKKRHLAKHKHEVDRFLTSIEALKPDSELVEKYRNRFLKYWPKMFTFLDFDGVPWNNNNAEHAIKRFAKYRRNADGCYTECSLKEYLVLASVLETCEFNKVNVLKFLLSKETTLSGLFKMAGRKPDLAQDIPSVQTSQPTGLPADAIPDTGSQP